MTTWFILNPNSKEFDISSWINQNGTLNIELLQKEIAADLQESVEKTKKWQRKAILLSVSTD